MKDNRKRIGIAIGIVLFLVATFFYYFEWVEVPDVKWESKTDFNSESPNGYWLFKNLLEDKFDQVNMRPFQVVDNQEASGSLFIYLNDDLYLYDEMDRIVARAEEGDHFFISSYYLYLNSTSFDLNHSKNTEGNQMSIDELSRKDTLLFYINDLDMPSAISVQNTADIATSTYLKTRELTASLRHLLYNHKNRVTKDEVNSIEILSCFEVGSGSICFHSAPYLFSNIFGREDLYLKHFNHIFDVYETQEATIVWPTSSLFDDDSVGRSPLRFILAQPSFKLAYYLILFTGFIFYVFGSKRKQKEVPIITRKENTSLEFVDTMARLTQSRQRHGRLMMLIKDNFYQFTEQKLFIKETDEDFWIKLMKKTKISTEELATLKLAVQRINPLETWSDEDIIETHQIFEDFYKKNRYGRK